MKLLPSKKLFMVLSAKACTTPIHVPSLCCLTSRSAPKGNDTPAITNEMFKFVLHGIDQICIPSVRVSNLVASLIAPSKLDR